MTKGVDWDFASGVCPYGHPIDECMVVCVRYNKGKKQYRYECNIRENYESRRRKHKQTGKGEVLPEWRPLYEQDDDWPTEPETEPTPIPRWGEPATEFSRLARVWLVCGHRNNYDRWHLEISGYYWCPECSEMKHIWKIPGRKPGSYARIWWPLEIPESDLLVEVTAHLGSQGSARA